MNPRAVTPPQGKDRSLSWRAQGLPWGVHKMAFPDFLCALQLCVSVTVKCVQPDPLLPYRTAAPPWHWFLLQSFSFTSPSVAWKELLFGWVFFFISPSVARKELLFGIFWYSVPAWSHLVGSPFFGVFSISSGALQRHPWPSDGLERSRIPQAAPWQPCGDAPGKGWKDQNSSHPAPPLELLHPATLMEQRIVREGRKILSLDPDDLWGPFQARLFSDFIISWFHDNADSYFNLLKNIFKYLNI